MKSQNAEILEYLETGKFTPCFFCGGASGAISRIKSNFLRYG